MLCQHCNTNDAVYHFLVQVGSRLGEAHLCAGCASRLYRSDFAGRRTPSPRGTDAGAQWPRWGGERQAPDSVDEDFSRRRRLRELDRMLRRAVDEEDYETAATLRDEIQKENNRVQSQAQ